MATCQPIEDFIIRHRAQLNPECQDELRTIGIQIENERGLFRAILGAIHAASKRIAANELAMLAALTSLESPLGRLLFAALGLSREKRQSMTLAELYTACDLVSDAIAKVGVQDHGR